MMSSVLIEAIQWAFLLYFIGLNLGYLMLNMLSFISLSRKLKTQISDEVSYVFSGLEPPISLLVPAYNEQATIAASIRSMLQLSYMQFEIVVINDGSKDETLAVLQQEFSLVPFPEAYQARLETKQIRLCYRSTKFPNLLVLDKENGGKADALNAGLNTCHYPLFCAVDADSVLQRDSLQRVVQPFLEDPAVIASGGTIRIANGCRISAGLLESVDMPSNWLALVQIIEYLRAFLFGRMGWSPLNAMLIISGAFGLFNKKVVIDAGGYSTKTVGEDMELVVRLHRLHRVSGKSYQIVFVPDSICWTEAPEDFKTLKNQRIRWQRGLAESLSMNRELLFHPKGGSVGWLAFPFMLVFEWLSPLLEVIGYLFLFGLVLLGMLSTQALWIYLLLSIGLGMVLSMSSLLLEQFIFHLYVRPRHFMLLMFALILENLGYRQVNSIWRLIGLGRWLAKSKIHWGDMKRKGWQPLE